MAATDSSGLDTTSRRLMMLRNGYRYLAEDRFTLKNQKLMSSLHSKRHSVGFLSALSEVMKAQVSLPI